MPDGAGCSSATTNSERPRWAPRCWRLSTADLVRRTAQADPRAGLALSPYAVWCTFATFLATHVWRLNRGERMMPALLWFRRDLRLRDHPALAAACRRRPRTCSPASSSTRAWRRRRARAACSSWVTRCGNCATTWMAGCWWYAAGPSSGFRCIANEIDASSVHISRGFRAVRSTPRRTGACGTGFGAVGGDGIAVSGFPGPRHQKGRRPLPGVHAVPARVARGRVARAGTIGRRFGALARSGAAAGRTVRDP